MRFVSIVVLSITLSTPPLVRAQRSTVTFDELRQTMLAASPQLDAARARVDQAEAALTQARARPNPSLDVSGGTDVMFANEGEHDLSVTYSHPVELGAKRRNRVAVAEAFLELTRAEVADMERRLTLRLWGLCVNAAAAAARVELLDEAAEVTEGQARIMDVRLDAGDASRLDSRLLAAQTGQLQAERLRSQGQLEGLLAQLRSTVGVPGQDSMTLEGFPSLPETAASRDAAVALALATRPDLQAARLREQWSEAGIDLARAQAVPDVALSATWARESSISRFATPLGPRAFEQDSVLRFGVSIPLPLFDRNRGNIGEAVSSRTQSRSEREALELEVRGEVLSAWERYESSSRAIDVMQSSVLDQTGEGLRIVQLAEGLGGMRLIDVLNQQRLLLDNELAYLEVKEELFLAGGELRSATGGPPPGLPAPPPGP